MKTKDFLIVALVPLALLLIPLAGQLTVEGWRWTTSDFVVAWVVFSITTFFYRLLATRPGANLAYKLGAIAAIGTGFVITWVNIAVQIIGDDNPGNLFYFLVLLGGLIGVGVSRFQAAGLAKVAFSMSAALLLVPVVAVLLWPNDFNPGFAKIFVGNLVLVGAFAVSGLLFRHAAGQSPKVAVA